jgi:trans-2,3-dihydro-3-hydroxyanthranilate isomerase
VARVTDLTLEDIADDVPIQTVSTGNAFAIVLLRSRAALENLKATWPRMRDYLEKTETKFFYFISREPVNPAARLQARMPFYNGEDPATGSAAGPCIAWAVKYGVIAPGEQALIEQGVEIKRKSRIFVRADREGDKIVNVRVAGHAVKVVQGEVLL